MKICKHCLEFMDWVGKDYDMDFDWKYPVINSQYYCLSNFQDQDGKCKSCFIFIVEKLNKLMQNNPIKLPENKERE